jgi:hypothetical protein
VTCFFDGIGARKGVEYACRGHVIDLFPFKLFACLRICDLPAIHDEQLIKLGACTYIWLICVAENYLSQ